jgi:hypothetical protein
MIAARKSGLIFPILLFTLFSLCRLVFAGDVSPMWGYLSLVAGEGDEGFRDGKFSSALFDKPTALALNAEGTQLYVADKDNHCIRVIDLENGNQVSTLAGNGKSGQSDGGMGSDVFENPALLAALPQNRLVVYDEGANCLRMIDLNGKKISNLLSFKRTKSKDSANKVFSLVYLPADNALYFSIPGIGSLQRMDMASLKVNSLQPDPRLPHPGALGVFQGKLCAADRDLPSVYQVDTNSNTSNGNFSATLTELGKGQTIVSLTAASARLYALQEGDEPWVQIVPNPGPVRLFTEWGDPMEKRDEPLTQLFNLSDGLGFLADPNHAGNFYMAHPRFNCVLSLKDYEFDQNKKTGTLNTDGLNDFSYPAAKPARTFRILEVGDSQLFWEAEAEFKRWPWGYNRMETIPKKEELLLNTMASVNGEDTHYEVLFSGETGVIPVQLLAYYKAPSLVEKFDVDLVLVFVHMDFNIRFNQEHPYGKEGMPLLGDDFNFLGKPIDQRLKENGDKVLTDFYQRCLALHMVKKGETITWDFPRYSSDARVMKYLEEIGRKPLKLLADKIRGMKTSSGNPVGLELVFFPMGNTGGLDILPTEIYRDFWMEAGKDAGIPFLDLTDDIVSTRLSYFPISEFGSYRHFNHNGHTYFANLVAQKLIKENLIPMKPQIPKP